jgi:hypothetical protein
MLLALILSNILSIQFIEKENTVKLHLYGLNGTTRHLDMQKIRIIEFFLENRLHGQFEMKNIEIAVFECIFIYIQIKY